MKNAPLTLHPDRLLPADPAVRVVARRLYEAVSSLPIVSPHGHVDPQMLLDDEPFADPASLLLQPDHYVTRLLHAGGVALDQLGVGEGPLPQDRARGAWRLLCGNWHLLRGTPVRYWFDSELADIFGVTERPSAANADALYDQISDTLRRDSHRPRALLHRFGIRFLATTDDPADGLDAHAALAHEPDLTTRVVPTFRPDRYLEAAQPGWTEAGQASRRRCGHRRQRLRRIRRPPWRSVAATSSRMAPPRPTTVTSTRSPLRWNAARRNASTAVLSTGRPL
jgi:glucuronate isomerase